VSILVIAYNEGDGVVLPLKRILEAVRLDSEIIVVVDFPDDTTVEFVNQISRHDSRVRVEVNTLGRGPANAIRFGFKVSCSPVVVVTMADGCDDASQIDALALLVERGVVVAAASRYARGGQLVGAPPLKSNLSKIAGITLRIFGRVGTWDSTNSFKAYSKTFVDRVGIESDSGFEVGLELVAKARRFSQPVAEIPTIWIERTVGSSNFKLAKWLSKYLKWYFFAFGPKITF
jgi:glycosyltransferase involved in cell wall biosynthesis